MQNTGCNTCTNQSTYPVKSWHKLKQQIKNYIIHEHKKEISFQNYDFFLSLSFYRKMQECLIWKGKKGEVFVFSWDEKNIKKITKDNFSLKLISLLNFWAKKALSKTRSSQVAWAKICVSKKRFSIFSGKKLSLNKKKSLLQLSTRFGKKSLNLSKKITKRLQNSLNLVKNQWHPWFRVEIERDWRHRAIHVFPGWNRKWLETFGRRCV